MSGRPPVLLLTDAAMDLHAAPGHPERPARREAAAAGVADGATAAGLRLARHPAADARPDLLATVHPPEWVEALERVEADGGGWIDPDTYLVAGSMRAARLAVGATIDAARSVARDEASVAFAAVRPPGHHAGATRASGFCLLNNVAVAAAALRVEGLAERVAIIDFDVHHGDGTQGVFDADPDVLYASTHQWPFYPGTGAATDRGLAPAAGTKHNRPLPAGTGDAGFLAAWTDELLPAVEAFAPDVILVSAGFDAHRADPLAHLDLSTEAFGMLALRIGALAARLDHRGVALTLEGGYDLDAVRAAAAAVVAGLAEGLVRG